MFVMYSLMLQVVVLVIELLPTRKLSLVFSKDLYSSCLLTDSLIFWLQEKSCNNVNGKAMMIHYGIYAIENHRMKCNLSRITSNLSSNKSLLPTTKGYVNNSRCQKL